MKSQLLKEITIAEIADLCSPSEDIYNLDEPLYSYRDNLYHERSYYSHEHDIDEVAGIYQEDQDNEIMSKYKNLSELIEDFMNNGTFKKWNETFTTVSYKDFINDFIERDLLPANSLHMISTQLKIGNITTNETFFDFVENIFNFYTSKHFIATEGFYAELVA